MNIFWILAIYVFPAKCVLLCMIAMMRSLVLTRHCTHWNCHGERNNESCQLWWWRLKTEGYLQTTTHHHPPTGHRSIQNSAGPAVPKPNLPLLTLQSAAVRRIFLGQKLRQTFTLSCPGPGGGLTGERTAHASEMDWFLVVMQAGNWQQSDGWWNSWPVTVKICSPDQTQSVKMLASRESLVLNSDIKNCKNIIEETVTSIEVNGKWLSSINGAIINYRYHSRFTQNTFFTRETHFNVGRQ